MADPAKTNWLTDIALPIFAFVSAASGPYGAAAANSLTAALSAGERRRAGRREEAQVTEALGLRRQQMEQESARQAEADRLALPGKQATALQDVLKGQALQDVMGTLNAPAPEAEAVQALGMPQVGRLQEALGRGEQVPLPMGQPSPQMVQERLGQMATTPGGAAQLATAGLEGVAQRAREAAPKPVDPREVAEQKRAFAQMIKQIPKERWTNPALPQELMARAREAKDENSISNLFLEVPVGIGADPEDIDAQTARELRAQGMSGIEILQSMAQAKREPKDPGEQAERQARIRKLEVETQALRAKAAGQIEPEKRAELKSKIRQDLRGEDVYKDYNDVLTGYNRVKIGTQMGQGPGDLAIVNGVVRLLDPNSVVRPSEFQTAANAQGWLDWAKAWAGRVQAGDVLAPETRQRFLDLAEQVYQSHAQQLTQEVGTVYGNVLKGTGISLNELFVQPQTLRSETEPSGQTVQLGAPPPMDATPAAQPTPAAEAPAFTIKGIREKGQ
jgi:hypothetical protein